MVEKDLLELIQCPESRQPLREAPAGLLERLNARQARGELRNRAGVVVAAPLAGGLVREDGRVLYPVLDGIPMLLLEEAIAVE
ncbi:MAG TPA: hypothetical protein VF530_14475 [Planctomycetota bacterium]